jgi:tRNA (cmo5U34)-methyltransferase
MEDVNSKPTWQFDSDVAENFDAHIHEQLPWYDLVSQTILPCVARHYIPKGGVVYDLGCATGNVEASIGGIIHERNAALTAIDQSKPMIDRYKGNAKTILADITEYEYESFDFAVSLLTLMFVPVAKRVIFADRLIDKLNDGGAIFLVERFLPPEGYAGLINARLTLQAKLETGAEPDKIIQKELSLRGVQRPLGRDDVKGHEIFRFGDFSGYILSNSRISV